MKTIIQLFTPFPKSVSEVYLDRAINITEQLANGNNYQALGGRRLVLDSKLVRFKFGSYRLIFIKKQKSLSPLLLIKRKDLNRFIKRRCS